MKRLRLFATACAVFVLTVLTIPFGAKLAAEGERGANAASDWFEIRVIDRDTGRGVPLVELETLDHRKFVSDSAGRIAIHEPGLMNRTVFFHWRSHGYEAPVTEGLVTDNPVRGGIEIEVKPGGKQVIAVKRLNIAERLYRNTGYGIYRDSVILGYPVPIAQPLLNANTIGLDGGQSMVYKGKVLWGYGDTNVLSKPWGNFKHTLMMSELPENGGLDPDVGIDFEYITNEDGTPKSLYPDWRDGVVWPAFIGELEIDGEMRLVEYYMNLRADWSMIEQGIAVYNEEEQKFEKYATIPNDEPWRIPNGWNVFRHVDDGREWIYFNVQFPNLRVPAKIEALADLSAYEAWTYLEDGSGKDPKTARVLRDDNGKLVARWTKHAPPITPQDELAFVQAGLIEPSEAYFLPKDVDTGKAVIMKAGNVFWNPWRERWVLIANEEGGSTSYLGEVWYAEAKEPTGPWKKAVKIISHDDYSFYNPTQHPMLSKENGRIIYIDGTYATSFSGASDWTLMYNYNLVRYRLDLSDPRVQAAWEADE